MEILRHEHRRQEGTLLQDITRSFCEDVRRLMELHPLFLMRMTVGNDEGMRVVGRYVVYAERLVSFFERPVTSYVSSSEIGGNDNDGERLGFGALKKLQRVLGKPFTLWNHRKRMRDERSKPP